MKGSLLLKFKIKLFDFFSTSLNSSLIIFIQTYTVNYIEVHWTDSCTPSSPMHIHRWSVSWLVCLSNRHAQCRASGQCLHLVVQL